jgi:hypothetical protein
LAHPVKAQNSFGENADDVEQPVVDFNISLWQLLFKSHVLFLIRWIQRPAGLHTPKQPRFVGILLRA